MSDKLSFTINEFCAAHGVSRPFLYVLWKRGDGPRRMLVGDKTLISAEAAADWRKAREAAALPVVERKSGSVPSPRQRKRSAA